MMVMDPIGTVSGGRAPTPGTGVGQLARRHADDACLTLFVWPTREWGAGDMPVMSTWQYREKRE